MVYSIKNIANRLISGTLATALTVQPTLAQSVVAVPGGPAVIQTASGITMVMIETPDANGISHNVYVEFNVGPDGLILNNAATNTALTELGGIIQGNSNLAGGAASIILNEVTSNNPSVLNGFLEVGGERADVIIANPYGITCDGCGFINTDRLTMTTGTPEYTGNGLGFSVEGGAIDIGAGGLDASTTTRFDIISRQITVAGAVQGQRIRVVAGRNDVIYATGEVIEKADDGSAKPTLAIDSTVLGGMYANAITIISTEDGVGVRAPQNMAANAGEMRISADGRLVMGSASAVGNMVLESSNDIVVEGTLVSTQNINVTSAEDLIIEANASLVADSVANLTVGNNISLETSAELAAGSAILADITGTVAVANAANFISNGMFDMAAGGVEVANGGTIAATGGALSLDALNDIQNSGLIFGNSALNLRSDAVIVNNGGALVSNGNLSIGGLSGALAASFTNQDGGLVETIAGNITIAALTIENLRPAPSVDGTLVTSEHDLSGETCAPLCYDPLVVGSTVTLNGEAAQIISSGNITLVGDTFSNRFSLLSARGDLSINVNSFENIGLNIYTSGGTGLELVGAVFGTVEAAGSILGVVSGYAQNDAVLAGVSGIGGSNVDVTGLDSGSIGNPNLLVVNVDPNATYLIESRPDFVDLDKFVSSDYFLDIIEYDPELKRFGDAYAEALYIRQQLLALLGQLILDGNIDERAQIQAMYDNAINEMDNLDLSAGVALTPTQISALTTDIIWMETVEIDGQMVLAPRVYLANPELRIAALGGAIISARNVAFYTGDFTNSGRLSAQESMVLNATNSFTSSGQISGSDILVTANSIDLGTQRVRLDSTHETFTELAARPSSLVAGNTLVLRATNDLVMAGTVIESGTSASLIAGGDIMVGALQLASENGRKTGKNHNRVETLHFLTSSITSGGDMMLLSSGNAEGQNDIVFEGADIYAAGSISMIAQGGDLVLAVVDNIAFTDRSRSRGNFIYKKVTRDQVFDISNKLSSLTGQSITGVSALDLVIEGTKFDVPGLPDGSLRPGALALVSVNAGLAFTAPTDIRAESHYVSRKILGGLITNSKDLRTLVTESLGSIADVAGDLLINSGADLTLTSVEFDIGGQFDTEVAGATYMLAAIDMDYRFLMEHRDNGIITTDIRSEDMRERVTFNAITAAGGINFDENSPIMFAGIRNPLIDAAHPAAWVAGDDTGRLNITEPFLGEESETAAGNEEGEYWRDGDKWSSEGKLNVLIASLPGAADGAQFGYVDDLLARESTVNQTIELLDYHFYEKKIALSPAFQVLVSIAVGNWVGTWGVWGSTTTALTTAGQAFASSMITQTIAGVVSGDLDFAKILENAAFAAVTAYATASVDFGEITGASNDSWIGAENGLLSPAKLLDGIGDEFITAGLNSAVYSTDFGQNLADGLRSFAISQTTSVLQFGVGNFKDSNKLSDGSFVAGLLHGVVGCASAEAAGGDCASGFITAFGTEIASGYMSKGFEPDPNASAVEQERARRAYAQQRAAMVGAALGYLTSGGNGTNVSQGSFIARSAVENNRQLHTRELIAIREKAAELAGENGLSEKEWLQRLTRAALVRTDRNWSNQFDGGDTAANAALDELIAAYGASFEDALGRQLGFFNETNTTYFNNAMFNVQFIAANKAFFNEALEGWVPQKWEGLQELLPPSDIAYLSAIHAQPYMGERISPDGDAVEQAVLKRDQNLQILAAAYELGRIKRQLATASWEIMNASDNTDVKIAWASATMYVDNQIMGSAWAIRDAILPGMVRGATDFFAENAAALAVLVYDLSLGAELAVVGVGGSAARNQARIDGIVYLLSHPGEVPAAIVNQMKADMAEAGRLFEAGDLDGAARIMGRMEAGVFSAVTGAVGAVQLSAAGARALAKITKTPIVYRQINAIGAEITTADLPTGFARVAHPNGDIVIMAPDGRVYRSVDEITVMPNNADKFANGPRLNNQLLAEEVANGHGFQKHVVDGGEFDNLGITTQSQYQDFVENIVSNPSTEVRYAANGKTFYLDTSTNTVVIKNPTGEATAFRPDYGPDGIGWNNFLDQQVPSAFQSIRNNPAADPVNNGRTY